MFSFKKKEKWTYARIGKFLADFFSESIIKGFEGEETEWLHSCFHDIDRSKLLQEWIYFNIFEMFQGINAYFIKNPEEGYKIIDEFIAFLGKNFYDAGLADNSFHEVLLSRLKIYDDALKEHTIRQPETSSNPLINLSKKACQLFGNENDFAASVGVIEHFTNMSVASKKLISDLLRQIKIAPNS